MVVYIFSNLSSLPVNTKRKKATPIVPGQSIGRAASNPTDTDPIIDNSDSDEEDRAGFTSSRRWKASDYGVQRNPYARRARNSHPRKAKTKAARNKLVDTSSDDEYDNTTLANLGDRRRTVIKVMGAIRIAIGKKVFSKACEVRYHRDSKQGRISLSYDGKKGERVYHDINLDDASIQEMKYYMANDDEDGKTISIDYDESEQMSFLAMQVDPNTDNGLSIFPNAYKPSPSKKGSNLAASKRYIAIEFRSDAEFKGLLRVMKKDATLSAFVDQSSKLRAADAEEYGLSLLEAARKERIARESSMGSPRVRRTRKKKRGSNISNEVLLVFPFGADEAKIDKAAVGLREAGFQSTSDSATRQENSEGGAADLKTSDEGMATASADDTETADDEDKEDSAGKAKSRAHFLTIRDEDYDRLQPGEFLNDTLIDFWFQWYAQYCILHLVPAVFHCISHHLISCC